MDLVDAVERSAFGYRAAFLVCRLVSLEAEDEVAVEWVFGSFAGAFPDEIECRARDNGELLLR